ncbi:MAG: hypothetical protein HS116_11295 [Planctomycetes bacterium]|nr:hypothetical protein [Planctomycetota bacterium]
MASRMLRNSGLAWAICLAWAGGLACGEEAPAYQPSAPADALKAVQGFLSEAAQSKAKLVVPFRFLGKLERAELAGADHRFLKLNVRGHAVDQEWSKLPPSELSALAEACLQDHGARALALADFCLAHGLTETADRLLTRAHRCDAALGPQLLPRWKFIERASQAGIEAKPDASNAKGPLPRTSEKATPPHLEQALREWSNVSTAGFDRRLGPDYAQLHPSGKSAAFPELFLPPDKISTTGRNGKGFIYQRAGPPTEAAGDYSSTQGQVLYVTDGAALGVDRVDILSMAHQCFIQKPQPPWWGGWRPEPSFEHAPWRAATNGNFGVPLAIARGMGGWSNCGLILFNSGFVAPAGTCTAKGSLPFFQFPSHKLPTSICVTPRNEFALVTVHDLKEKKGQLAVLALESSAKETRFAHEWQDDHPCLPNVAVFTRIKLLGYVDLPGLVLPSGVCASGNRTWSWLKSLDGKNALPREINLNDARVRNSFAKGNNAHWLCSAGYAVVISRQDSKAAFVDLQPLFEYVRARYATSDALYRKTRDAGPEPDRWPHTFEHAPAFKPIVVRTLDVAEPVAVRTAMTGGADARACIASRDGKLGIYRLGGLATEDPANPAEIGRSGELQLGCNPVWLAYSKGRGERGAFGLIAVCRGDREIQWVSVQGDAARVTRRLRDARMLDPVYAEVADTHGISTSILTVCDFKGRKIINYRFGALHLGTNGPQTIGMGPEGKDEFECGGWMDLPGAPFAISAANVN